MFQFSAGQGSNAEAMGKPTAPPADPLKEMMDGDYEGKRRSNRSGRELVVAPE